MSIDKSNLLKPTILIVDANNLAKRSIHAHESLKIKDNGKIIYTGLAYGFITNLIYMNKEFKPKYMILVWDGGSTYRKNLFAGYKQKRHAKKDNDIKIYNEKMKDGNHDSENPPHDFIKELKILSDILKYLGVQQYHTVGEEADDLIGTLCKKLWKKNKIIISSNDHDFLQLLQFDDVTLFRSYGNKRETITKKNFLKKYKFDPKYYVNALAIGGDTTDEYPGVKGISLNTALTLVKDHGFKLETILAKATQGNIPGRPGVLLKSSQEMARLCRKLAKIRTNIELNSKETSFDLKMIKDLFRLLKFHSLLFPDKIREIKNLPKNHVKT